MFKTRHQKLLLALTPQYSHTTDSDFTGDTLTNCAIVGTGAGAYIGVDTGTYFASSVKTSTDEDGAWSKDNALYDWRDGSTRSPLEKIRAEDASTIQADLPTQNVYSGYSSIMVCKGFGFNIPSGSVISGIKIRWKRNCTESDPTNIWDGLVRPIITSPLAYGDPKTSNRIPNALETTTYGGASDLWGETWTRTQINSANFGCEIQARNRTSNAVTVYGDYVEMTVYYNLGPVTFVSGSISLSNPVIQLDYDITTPGTTGITFDVLNAGDDTLQRANVASGEMLTNINSPIKIRANITPVSGTATPQINSVTVSDGYIISKVF